MHILRHLYSQEAHDREPDLYHHAYDSKLEELSDHRCL